MFRKLKAHEIDCRVQSITEKGAVMLLYKDARCDMNILDETVGAMYWKREHTRDNQNCIVSIYNKDIGQWISKEDTGTESNSEAEKGLASDSFKRACFNWGIGRELYTAGFIYIKSDVIKIENKNGRYSTYDKFSVSEIGYDEHGSINVLELINQNGTIVFSRGKSGKTEPKKETVKETEKITPEQVKAVHTLITKTKTDPERIKKYYTVNSSKELTKKQAAEIIDKLSKKVEEIKFLDAPEGTGEVDSGGNPIK